MSAPHGPTPVPASPPPRRRRARRAIACGGIAALLFLATTIALLVWAVGSQSGARFVFAHLSGLLPGTLETGVIEGPIRGPLTLHDLRYATDRVEVGIHEVTLDWRLGALRQRLVDVHTFTARGVRVRILPGAETAQRQPPGDLDLRFDVAVHRLLVEDVQIEGPGGGRPVVIDRLSVRTAAWRDALRIEEASVVSPDVDLDARGWLRPRGDYPLDVQVVWAYRPPDQRPPLAGHGRLSGSLRALRLDQRLDAPSPATLRGTVSEALFDPRFTGTIDLSGFSPRRYAAASPVTAVSGHLALTRASLAELAASGHARLAVEGWGEVDANLALHHAGDRWHFDHLTVQRPGASGELTWEGDLITPNGELPRVAGTASWKHLTWPLDGARPVVRSDRGSVQVEGSVDDYDLVVDGIFAFPEVPAGRWQATGHGDRRQLVAQTLEARLLGGRLAGNARVQWQPAVAWSVQATATGIDPHATWPAAPVVLAGSSWRVAGRGDAGTMAVESLRVEAASGTLVATGGLDWGERGISWRADARTHGMSPAALLPQLPAGLAGGDWHLVGRGTDRRAELSRLEGAFLGGSATAAGTIAWQPNLSWRLQGSATRLDPGTAFAGWNGSLSGTFRTHGEAVGGGINGEVTVADVAGTLRERPLTAHGTVLLHQGTVSLSGVAGGWGPGRLAASGEISPQLALTFDVQRLDLASLAAGATGIVSAGGTLRGATAAPVVTVSFRGARVGWGTDQAAAVGGHLTLDLAAGGVLDVAITADDLRVRHQPIDSLRFSAHGTRETHDVRLTLRGVEETLDLEANGGLGGLGTGPSTADGSTATPHWSGTLTRLGAEAGELGQWRLAAPTRVTIGGSEARIRQLCWESQAARLCADLDWRSQASPGGERLAIAATARELPLATLERLLPGDLRLAGTIDGEAQLRTTPDGVLLGQATLRPSPGTALWSATGGDATRAQVAGGDVRLTADPAGVAVLADLALADGGRVRGSVNLAGYHLGRDAGEQPLVGRLTAQLGDLRFLQAAVPTLGTTSGLASADLALSGTLAEPSVAGSVRLTGASAAVPSLGLQLTEIELAATGDGHGPLTIAGSLRSGAGTLKVGGTTPLLPGKEHPLRLDLVGQRVEVANLDEAHVVADPNLQLAYDGSLLRVVGSVQVPQAKVVYKSSPAGAVQPSSDVVFVGSLVPQAVNTGTRTSARVRIVLGNDVNLSAQGLETKVRGAVLVIEEPGQDTRANGELELAEGTFKAYGQNLVIEHGRLYFAGGSILDPGIDVRAHRNVAEDNVVAGIDARGTLRQPEVTVWSQPTMSESEALSYLVLGRPLESAQPQEGSLLTSAATSLGVRGGSLLAKKVGASLGLEEASIVSGKTYEQAAFVVGKYLSPRLYVSYGVGIFDAASTLRLRYKVSEHLQIEAETGARTTGDVLYTVEHGPPSREELRQRYHQHDLPRVSPEEMTTPPKVPVGPAGAEPAPHGTETARPQAQQVGPQAEDRKQPEPPQPPR